MGARVLVVDDDPWILRMVTATLEKKSYVVDTAREGRQALERAAAHPPDVIVSDVMMPVMDGWTLVQNLRAHPQLSAIPVIFLTALGKDEARLSEMGLTPDEYLAKPFRFDDLEKRVRKALARSASGSGSGGWPAYESGTGSRPGHDSGTYPAHHTPANINYTPAPGMRAPTPPPGTLPSPAPGAYEPAAPPHPGEQPGSSPGPHPAPGYGYPPNPPYSPYGSPYGGGYPGYPPPHPSQYPPSQYPPNYPGYPGNATGYPGGATGYPGGAPGGYPGAGGYPPYGPGQHQGGYPPGPGQAPQAPAAQPPAQEEDDEPKRTSNTGSFTAQRRSTALNGRIEQLGLSSLLVMMEMERKDGVLSLKEADSGDIGRIFLRGGQVVKAKLDDHPDIGGRDCVYEMLRWKKGTFSFNAMEVEMEDTIKSSTTHLLMEGARLIDEANRDEF